MGIVGPGFHIHKHCYLDLGAAMKTTFIQELKDTAKDVFIDAPGYFVECVRDSDTASTTLVIAGILILVSWVLSPLIVPVSAALNYVRQGDTE